MHCTLKLVMDGELNGSLNNNSVLCNSLSMFNVVEVSGTL